jgi:cytochrome c oxidase subunit 2
MPFFERYIAEASTMAGRVDALFLGLFIISSVVVVGITVVITVFAIRYRRGTLTSRSGPMKRNRTVEITWIAVPLVIFLGIFVWGAVLYQQLYLPPDRALQISVVGKQWMWKFRHPGGQREIDQLHVPAGRPIRLIMTSQDVIHSFFVPAFRVKQDVLPERYTSVWFQPTREGEYQLFCAELCGTDHSKMRGTIVVISPAAYQRWLEANPSSESLATRGAKIFRPLRRQRTWLLTSAAARSLSNSAISGSSAMQPPWECGCFSQPRCCFSGFCSPATP